MKGKDLIRHAEEQHQAKMAASHPADLALPAPNDSTDTSIAPDKNTSGSEEGLALIVSFSYLGFAIGGGARLWYHAALWQEKFRGLRLGDIRFKCDVTGKGLLKLWAINILIIIFSLGLAKPIATNRVVRYYTRNIRIGGDVNALCALQSKAAKTSGIGDALAADVGFDLGL